MGLHLSFLFQVISSWHVAMLLISMLFLYPTTLLNSFISSKGVLVKCLVLYIRSCHLQTVTVLLPFYLVSFYSFLLPVSFGYYV
jgi:hypothetical protein